ncbi:MAG: PPOX class F420-dependent oxidoreductase [Thermomicrobiales bacterium]
MPTAPVPAAYHDILQSTVLGHMATTDETGRPEVNPVWFIWDGDYLLISIKAATRKYRNLRRDPRVAVSFEDANNPERYLEVRGEVVEFVRYDTLEFVNELARKYTGAEFQHGHAGQERYKLVIRIDSWTAQN